MATPEPSPAAAATVQAESAFRNRLLASSIGLATAVTPDATFRDDVYAFAERLAAQAPLSIALAKEQLNHGSERTYDTALLTELEGVLACMMTRDWQEGIDAFAAKRKPVFRGE